VANPASWPTKREVFTDRRIRSPREDEIYQPDGSSVKTAQHRMTVFSGRRHGFERNRGLDQDRSSFYNGLGSTLREALS
jgi:hypothetical protein